MTLTKEQSSNKERYEAAPTSEIVNIIRNAMSEGCIRPSHVYDAVDELICRIEAAHRCEAIPNCTKFGNAAKTLEALQKIYASVNSLDEECGVDPIDIRDMAKEALSEPPRNCDRFGGDPKRLHDEWWEWSGKRENCNEDGTVKMTYGEWLLEKAKGATDGST